MKQFVATTSALACVASAAIAEAQQPTPTAAAEPGGERSWFEQRVGAPSEAFELTVDSAYTQGFGMLDQGTGFPSVATAGVGVSLGAGYRIDPKWGISAIVQYQELTAERADGTRGVTGTIAGQYHFMPEQRLDPWVELGTGYRMLWETQSGPAPNVFSHGLQLARARVGADFRVSPDASIGPFIGADANVFLFQDGDVIDSTRLSTFVLAGIQGRIDVGGTRSSSAGPAFAGR